VAVMRLPPATRNAQADALRQLIDAGEGPGTIRFYSAPMPETALTEIKEQTLLATLTFAQPCAEDPAGGTGCVPAVYGADLDLGAGLVQSSQCVFRASAIAIDDGRKTQAALTTETWKNHDRTARSSADRHAFQLFVLGQAAR